MRVGVAIDTSNSVTSRFRFEQVAASAFFHQVMDRNADLGFVMGFENHPTVTQDFVGDPDLLAKGVERLTIGGGTALYDAILAACQKLVHRPEEDTVARVLVVVSDGLNNAGVVSLERAIDAAQEAEVAIYAISTNYTLSPSQLASSIQAEFDAKNGNSNLRQLAEQTGGLMLRPHSPKDVTKSFEKISQELRSRYAVSYKPADFTPDGHFRTIKIEAQATGKSWRFGPGRDITQEPRLCSVPILQIVCHPCGKTTAQAPEGSTHNDVIPVHPLVWPHIDLPDIS